MKVCPVVATVAITLGAAVALGVAVALFVIFSGVFNVSALEPHAAITEWVLEETAESSVKAHAKSVVLPEGFASISPREAVPRFEQLCVTCHGGPGEMRSEIGMGLNPTAPSLSEEAEEWTPQQLYWIIANGIKMTGMPAFGPTQEADQLWQLTALVVQLPKVSEQTYAEWAAAAPGAPATQPHE